MLDLAAERAREVALEERLELDEQRELLGALAPLAQQVGRRSGGSVGAGRSSAHLSWEREAHRLGSNTFLADLDRAEPRERLEDRVTSTRAPRRRR